MLPAAAHVCLLARGSSRGGASIPEAEANLASVIRYLAGCQDLISTGHWDAWLKIMATNNFSSVGLVVLCVLIQKPGLPTDWPNVLSLPTSRFFVYATSIERWSQSITGLIAKLTPLGLQSTALTREAFLY